MYVRDDRVLETSTTTGTGALTLAGAVTGYKTFASAKRDDGTAIQVGDVVPYYIEAVDGNGVPTGAYESGIGTYSAAATLTRTTVLRSSNSDAAVSFAAGTKYVGLGLLGSRIVQLDNANVMNLPIVSANPSAPPTDTLALYARKMAGRVLPKFTPPSGVDSPLQPALFGNNVVMYMPNTGTTVGLALGTPWAVGTTVAHPAPTSTSMYTQMKRTTSLNVVTTTNQLNSVSSIVNTAAQFWRGNAAGLGGFFFFARFGIEAVAANTTRLFAGLQSGTTNILASDTIPAISCIGLWHDTTDGANVINLLTKNGTTATKNALAGSPTTPYSAGQGYDFYLFAKPNDTVIYYRLDNLNTGAILSEGSVTTTIPAAATFMGPCVGMSNGTANVTAATTGIGVNRIYVESDH